MARPFQVTMDAADPTRLAAFWAAALGYEVQPPPPGFASWEELLESQGVPRDQWGAASAIIDPDGVRPRIFFQRVPEPKAAKNRVHLDLQSGGGPGVPLDEQRRRVQDEVGRLVSLGATEVGEQADLGVYWVVLRDPEGNEFCA
jgi:hypothetical protein